MTISFRGKTQSFGFLQITILGDSRPSTLRNRNVEIAFSVKKEGEGVLLTLKFTVFCTKPTVESETVMVERRRLDEQ